MEQPALAMKPKEISKYLQVVQVINIVVLLDQLLLELTVLALTVLTDSRILHTGSVLQHQQYAQLYQQQLMEITAIAYSAIEQTLQLLEHP